MTDSTGPKPPPLIQTDGLPQMTARVLKEAVETARQQMDVAKTAKDRSELREILGNGAPDHG